MRLTQLFMSEHELAELTLGMYKSEGGTVEPPPLPSVVIDAKEERGLEDILQVEVSSGTSSRSSGPAHERSPPHGASAYRSPKTPESPMVGAVLSVDVAVDNHKRGGESVPTPTTPVPRGREGTLTRAKSAPQPANSQRRESRA